MEKELSSVPLWGTASSFKNRWSRTKLSQPRLLQLLETGTQLKTPKFMWQQPTFINGNPFYRGSKFPVLTHLIGWGLSTTQLTDQLDVCSLDRMRLARVPCLSLNPTCHCLIQDLLFLFSKELCWLSWGLLGPVHLCSLQNSCSCHMRQPCIRELFLVTKNNNSKRSCPTEEG